MKFFFTFLFSIAILFVSAQDYPTGLLFDDEAYAAAPSMPDYGDGSKAVERNLRENLRIDLKPYTPHNTIGKNERGDR
jgi:hypothetical protein